MPGGFSAMNTFVRETICHALQASNIHYEQTFKGLMAELTARIDRDQEITGEGESREGAGLPTLLTSPKATSNQKIRSTALCTVCPANTKN